LIAFSDRNEEFAKRNCQLLFASVDSKYTHLAWIDTPRNKGGLGHLKFPLIADLTKKISADYGVLLESGVALRGTFLIDKQGIVRHITVNDTGLGRSVDETLRVLDAVQHMEQHGEVCPADWTPGGVAMKPSLSGSREYFAKVR
jgi:alkyl hydroperoxide reductase subunit AhpC